MNFRCINGLSYTKTVLLAIIELWIRHLTERFDVFCWCIPTYAKLEIKYGENNFGYMY